MNIRKKRVMFVLPSLKRGGAEAQVIDLVNGIDPGFCEKYLFTFEQGNDLLEKLDKDNVNLYQSFRRHKLDAAPILKLAELIDELQIDVLHCSLQMSLFIGWMARLRARKRTKLILALHTTINRYRKTELFDRLLYQWLMRRCDKVICVCRAQEKHWIEKYPFLRGRTEVVYNGIDVTRFDIGKLGNRGTNLKKQYGILKQSFVATCIAGFRVEKGHSILIDAFKILAPDYENAYLLLAGDGVLRSNMEELVRQKGLSGRIIFLGNLKDVRSLLAASDVSVLASTAETFSIAALESLAMGVPVVATDIGGMSESVRHMETGIIVPAGDAKKLSEGIRFLLEHRDERKIMGASGIELTRGEFNREQMIKNTERLLENLF